MSRIRSQPSQQKQQDQQWWSFINDGKKYTKHGFKNVYAEADYLLTFNAKNAMGMGGDGAGNGIEMCMSTIYRNKIAIGPYAAITRALVLPRGGDGRYSQSTLVDVNGAKLPAFPLLVDVNGGPIPLDSLPPINKQCIRQFVRVVQNTYNSRHGTNDDIHMYLVAAKMLRLVIVVSSLGGDASSDECAVVASYRSLMTIMLGKIRMAYKTTELEYFEQGKLPIPNHDSIAEFHKYMKKVGKQELGIDVDINSDQASTQQQNISPMSLWYGMCVALQNTALCDAQRIHCVADLRKDGIEPGNILNVISAAMSDTHKTITVYRLPPPPPPSHITTTLRSGTDGGVCDNIVVVALAGTVGAGKTTWADLVQKTLEEENRTNVTSSLGSSLAKASMSYASAATTTSAAVQQPTGSVAATSKWVVYNKGTDEYCATQNMRVPQAASKVREFFQGARKLAGTGCRVCVIVDTCGQDNVSVSDIFGVNFEGATLLKVTPNYWGHGWGGETKLDEYMAWSLRNVLMRGARKPNSRFFLNHVSAGVDVCKRVCATKLNRMTGCATPVISNSQERGQILKDIAPLADAYQALIDEKHPLDGEVAKVVEAIRGAVRVVL